MPGIFAFCRCVGEAVLAKGARGLAGLVPFGDHLYDIAAHALKRCPDAPTSPAESVGRATEPSLR